MKDFNQKIIEEFRANNGVVGGPFEGASLVIITTKGAKSGKRRENPLVCYEGDDGTLYIFASKGGAPTDPDWYRNLVAHPEVKVEFGDTDFQATAVEVRGEKRDQIYAEQVKRMPTFDEYQKKAGRVIPVVALIAN
jgi:deazaflavin-dependent oxidoreductase (nitroreductase family)